MRRCIAPPEVPPPVTESDLRRYCRERLTPYKVPRIVEFCDELPMTVTGKVLRHELHKRMG